MTWDVERSVVEGEIVADGVVVGGEIVPVERDDGVTLFGTSNPVEVIERSTQVADFLAKIIADRKLFAEIKGRKHVLVEGWTLLGSMLGVFPVMDDVREVVIDGVHGWEATVSAKTRNGEVVGRASALCMRSEARWKTADEYAVSSMAQTRATSKALRLPLGFVMQIAGYDATPAEEMRAEAQQEKAIEFVSPATLEYLNEVLVMAQERDPVLWSEQGVLRSASRKFERQIESLDKMTEVEATTVAQGAAHWVSEHLEVGS